MGVKVHILIVNTIVLVIIRIVRLKEVSVFLRLVIQIIFVLKKICNYVLRGVHNAVMS